MKNNKKISLIQSICKRDRLKELKSYAQEGNTLAQLMLGEIYFYAITPEHSYLNELLNLVALDKANEKSQGKKKPSAGRYSIALVCRCEENYSPDIALSWYEKACSAGNNHACRMITEIQNTDDSFTQKPRSMIQFFKIDWTQNGGNRYEIKRLAFK